VLAINPPFGPPGGGNTATITAANVDVPTAVLFGSAAASVTRITHTAPMTPMDVRAPAGGAVDDVTVLSPVATSATTEQDEFSSNFGSVPATGNPSPGRFSTFC